jgi:hypothetical protein
MAAEVRSVMSIPSASKIGSRALAASLRVSPLS